jgi:hypothetical protein
MADLDPWESPDQPTIPTVTWVRGYNELNWNDHNWYQVNVYSPDGETRDLIPRSGYGEAGINEGPVRQYLAGAGVTDETKISAILAFFFAGGTWPADKLDPNAAAPKTPAGPTVQPKPPGTQTPTLTFDAFMKKYSWYVVGGAAALVLVMTMGKK